MPTLDSLKRFMTPTELAKMVDCHCIKASFRTKPMDMRDTAPSLKLCVDMKLVDQGVNLSFNLLEFNDNIVS